MVAIRKCTENFVATLVDDEILIVDLDGGELLSLEGTGRAVWELIDGERDTAAIAEQLIERFDAPDGQIDADLGHLLKDLSEARLIELT